MQPFERIKQLRIKKNLTTYDLAEITGISQSTISKIENNKRKIDTETLTKLADALNVSTNDLLGIEIEEHVVEDLHKALLIILESDELTLDDVELNADEKETMKDFFEMGINFLRRTREKKK